MTILSKATQTERLTKELYFITEAISVCDGLLVSVQSAKEQIKRQCNDYREEMSLSKEEWTENLAEINAIEKNVQSMINRYTNVQRRVQKTLNEIDGRKGGGSFIGSDKPVKR